MIWTDIASLTPPGLMAKAWKLAPLLVIGSFAFIAYGTKVTALPMIGFLALFFINDTFEDLHQSIFFIFVLGIAVLCVVPVYIRNVWIDAISNACYMLGLVMWVEWAQALPTADNSITYDIIVWYALPIAILMAPIANYYYANYRKNR